jgi:hypothetical protein
VSSFAILRGDLVKRLCERDEVPREESITEGPRLEESPDLWVIQRSLAVWRTAPVPIVDHVWRLSTGRDGDDQATTVWVARVRDDVGSQGQRRC